MVTEKTLPCQFSELRRVLGIVHIWSFGIQNSANDQLNPATLLQVMVGHSEQFPNFCLRRRVLFQRYINL